ncbi:hypothetical protein [Pontibacter chitinilyticus]|uniref:hypothetical protein n=1 Tax=Pontibacter chitinilyticus TaxID=2674989 RepID=UPI0032194A31
MLEIIKSLLLSFFAIAVLLPVIRYAMRRLSPAQQPAVLDAEELKYIQRQELKLTLAYYVFAVVLSVFAAGMLALVASILHAYTLNGSSYVLTPNFRALFAPGLLIGLTLALLPLKVIQSTMLGHDYELYQTYIQHQEGQNSRRAYGILFVVMLVLSAVVGWFAMRWHVTVHEDSIRITNVLLQERTYAIKDISSIQSLGVEGEYVIRFNDQYNINTAYLKPVPPEMIALLSQESGKRVIH